MPDRMKKPLSWFKKQPQVRLKESAIQEMAESLKDDGQLQDVAALVDGLLIFGHRRLAGAELAGLKELWVQVYESLTIAQITVMQLIENMQREDLTGYEQWQGCVKLMELEPGLALKDLAKRLHKDPSTITRIMSPSRLIPVWVDALKSGAVGISDCYPASRCNEHEQHEMLAAKLGGSSRDDLERQVRRKRNGSTPAVRTRKIRCPLPGGHVVTVAGDEISLDDGIESLGEALKAMKKARADGLDSKTAQLVWADVAAAR